jgi:thiamine kinase-like enzyme
VTHSAPEGMREDVQEIVAQLSALLGPREGEIEAVPGVLTKLAFRVRLGGADYVVHLPGREAGVLGIDPHAEPQAGVRAAELGIGPPVVATLEHPACFVTQLAGGRALEAAEMREPGVLAELAAALRSFHDSGLELTRTFDPHTWVQECGRKAVERGVEMPEGYERALAYARKIERKVARHPDDRISPCHTNLTPPNIWHDGERILITGWRYGAMCDRLYDLGDLAASIELDDEGERRLLTSYFDEEPRRRRLATIKLMRFLSELVEAVWGLLESSVSELDVDFSGHARVHVVKLNALVDDPRFHSWIRDAARRR